jgi:hypothetical protein
MQDIGRKLLQSVGFREPDDVSIQAAIELNDTFIDELQRIFAFAALLVFGAVILTWWGVLAWLIWRVI